MLSRKKKSAASVESTDSATSTLVINIDTEPDLDLEEPIYEEVSVSRADKAKTDKEKLKVNNESDGKNKEKEHSISDDGYEGSHNGAYDNEGFEKEKYLNNVKENDDNGGFEKERDVSMLKEQLNAEMQRESVGDDLPDEDREMLKRYLEKEAPR